MYIYMTLDQSNYDVQIILQKEMWYVWFYKGCQVGMATTPEILKQSLLAQTDRRAFPECATTASTLSPATSVCDKFVFPLDNILKATDSLATMSL